jgi:hypothetical protein
VPLTPKQVREDQLKLQKSNEKRGKKKGRPKLKKKKKKEREKNIDQSVKEREYFGHSESKRGNIQLHCKKKKKPKNLSRNQGDKFGCLNATRLT